MAEDVSAAHAMGTIALWSREYKAWRSLPSGSSVLDLRYEEVVGDLDGTLTLTLTLTLSLTRTRTRTRTRTLTLTLKRALTLTLTLALTQTITLTLTLP